MNNGFFVIPTKVGIQILPVSPGFPLQSTTTIAAGMTKRPYFLHYSPNSEASLAKGTEVMYSFLGSGTFGSRTLNNKKEVFVEILEDEIPIDQSLVTYSGYGLYLREVGKAKLLTPVEEVRLAKRIKKGDGEAREQMIKANLRFVVKIAREFENFGLPLLDLINEGNIGLMKAVERFDPAKGAKLSTYASWWIKQSIRRALSNQAKTIRLPVHVGDKLLRIRRASLKLLEAFGREPTDEEIAEELDIPTQRVTMLRTAGIAPTSLHANVGEHETDIFGDFVKDETAPDPASELNMRLLCEMLRDRLLLLPERERTILELRFGLNGGKRWTLEEVGRKFNVTRERIRQVQNIVLDKLNKFLTRRNVQKDFML